MATSIIMTSTDQGGNKLQKTLTSINPNASAADIRTFATAVNGLTTNNYVGTNRIDKTNLNAAKLPVTISVGTKNNNYNSRVITITGGTDALPYIKSNNTLHYARIIRATEDTADVSAGTLLFTWLIQPEYQYSQFGAGKTVDIHSTNQDGLINTDLDITIAVPETDTHQAAEVTFSVF